MTALETLRQANPHLRIHTIHDASFARYGRVIDTFHPTLLMDACRHALTLPETGSVYQQSLDVLEALPDAVTLCRTHYGELPIQIGVCYGHSTALNALEYHKSSEINVAVTPMLLLLGDVRDIHANRYDAALIEGFYLAAGDVIEVYATTLHFCPCQTSDAGFLSIVVLPRGTNAPLTDTVQAANAESALLFRQNKWLLCHEDHIGLRQKGVVPGIFGENYQIGYSGKE